ncbi:MAG: ATP-binding protein [candidate division KSB1 bacterium]|jgi:PAS domain S-box-containing protein|nr:ATP-binding protein [candidate division KSB1 bacterium]
MAKRNILKSAILSTRSIVLIFLTLTILMLSSALIELNQSKKELLDLMENQAHTLLGSLLGASDNALMTYDYLETFLEERLLNNANYIRSIYESGQLSNTTLQRIANENNLFRIHIYNNMGERIYTSYPRSGRRSSSPGELLQPIFTGEKDTVLIGLKQAEFDEGYRYAVAISAKDSSAILLNLDAEDMLTFRRSIGFGSLLKEMINNPGIVYVALQDTSGIIATSGNITELDRIVDSEFLMTSLRDSTFEVRQTKFGDIDIMETVHPFYFQDISIGLFRMGLSLDPLNQIKSRIYRRILILSAVLMLIGAILFISIMIQQNYNLLRKQYQVVDTYSSSILKNVSDAIIVYGADQRIKIFNKGAEKIFHKSSNEVVGKSFFSVLSESNCAKILSSAIHLAEIDCFIQERKKYLLVSKNTFIDEKSILNTILIIRDITEQRTLEAHVERNERLSAMGELASGVAHEIRNPLNTIGTIIQQLEKDFEPKANGDEYRQLSGLVLREVQRINDTVQDFLRFSRPEPLQVTEFSLMGFIEEIQKQYRAMLENSDITMSVESDWSGIVRWDERQMRQVFMNLIQNALESIEKGGEITIIISSENDHDLEIRIMDTGTGISSSDRSKIFNLYFTTKARGTGIGLSIVQRIIHEHNGIITVESDGKSWTTFIINLPINIQD